MSLEIVIQFLFQNNEIIFETSKKLIWTEKFPSYLSILVEAKDYTLHLYISL